MSRDRENLKMPSKCEKSHFFKFLWFNHKKSMIVVFGIFHHYVRKTWYFGWETSNLSNTKNVDYKFVDKICRKKICRFDKIGIQICRIRQILLKNVDYCIVTCLSMNFKFNYDHLKCDLESTWNQLGINLESTRNQLGINLVSLPSEFRIQVNLVFGSHFDELNFNIIETWLQVDSKLIPSWFQVNSKLISS